MLMRVLRVALAGLMLVAFGTTAQAAPIWIDGGDADSAFETPVGAGNTPTGWAQINAPTAPTNLVHTDTVANGGQVLEGDQSVKLLGAGRRGIARQIAGLQDSGEYRFMFYDDMSGFTDQTPAKNGRVGLTRPADNFADLTTINPRFAAMGVETNQSRTHYMWHMAFAFGATTVQRSLGWHEMGMQWDVVPDIVPVTRVQYYVDGVLGATRFHAGVFTPTGEIVSAPFGATTPIWVDVIPEPTTFALTALACVGLLGARRRVK
jgi:hypothetical protein